MHELTVVLQRVTETGPMWLIPLFPFVGAVINGLFGKLLQDRVGKSAVHTIAIGVMCGAALLSVIFCIKLAALPEGARNLHSLAFPMVSIGAARFDMAFAMDPLSATMALIITIVGTLIHIYSVGYMHEEPAYWRFFTYLNLFVFSMLLLVLGDNFIVMFFGWEGVGLCSYLLIGFWYKDYKKATAGMKAFVVNRVGDWGFICGLSLLFWGMGGAWVGEGRYHPDFRARFIAVEAEKLAEGEEDEHEDKAKGHEDKAKEHEGKGEKAKEHGSLGGLLEGTAHAADEHGK